MKTLPKVLAGLHAIVTCLVFGLAIASPERSGLLPVLLFFADLPVSPAMNWLRNILHPDWGVRSNLFVDYLVFLLIGSMWYYLVGFIISAALGTRSK